MATRPLSRAARNLPERYEAVRHVAEGGMASVWEAHDTVLGRAVAVKLLHPALAADPDARMRFTREARAAARLSRHQHVMTVFDAGEHDEQAFIVMALYRGTIAHRLRHGPVDRDRALRWLADAAAGLDAAHAEGVVHRDVKPANLLLDEHDRVVVGDFGIATAAWATSITRTGFVLGTGPYLAPEQRAGERAEAAADVYALAVVAHELLTGRKPEPGIPADPPALPGPAADVLRRATAQDPADRPATAGALVAALAEALGEPTAATAALPPRAPARAPAALPPLEPVARERRRSRAGTLAAVASAALLAGVLAAALAGGDPPAPSSATSAAKTSGRTARKPAAPDRSTPTAAAAQAPSDGRTLNDQGFALLNQGRAADAVALLRRAVAALSATPGDITYAYALFNLGHALRLAGQPAEAVRVLEQRLAVNGSDQRDKVEAELAAARREAGLAPADGKPGKGHGKAKRPKGSGG